MAHWRIKLSLFLNYFVIAMLLNSVGTVILQVQNSYGVSESSASVLEAFKDLSIAAVSFLVASYIARIGYKRAMLIALAMVGSACLVMPSLGNFWMIKLLFAVTGTAFALIKVSVYATLGIVTANKREHASLMNFIESFFMVGILTGYFVFSAFVNDADKQSTSWLNVYYLCAAIAFTAFLLLLSAPLDESSVQENKPKPLLEDFLEMITLAIKPLVLIFIISAFTYVLIEQSIMSWLPTFNSKVLHLPATLSIQMASILAASTALGRFSAGFALRKFHWFYVLVICLIAAASLVLVAIPLARSASNSEITGWGSAPLGAFVFPLIGLFIAPIYPAINSVILSSLPPRQHGPMSGLIVIFSALGGTTGSIITGNIFQTFGGQTAFYFSLIPLTVLLICLYIFYKLQVRQEVKVEFTSSSH
ncbi:MAG: MFS transporter [Bacteroidetes bacterium]|nr:MFS transporter [Bacteroidota bacterium]MBS1541967.1 MFS transporter [Bacteroidota bacterium]